MKRALVTAPFLFVRLQRKATIATATQLTLLTLLLATGSHLQAAADCSTGSHFDATGHVSHVYDGDTVKLHDGRKLRFIGINTPEMKHRNKAAEPFANAARLRLLELMGKQRGLGLRFDRQKQDHYGRQLAHVFLPDGRSINHILISEGLAMALRVPPNDWQHSCYAKAEDEARKRQRGIWSHPRYQVVAASSLDAHTRGYRFVKGRVTRIGHSRSSVWLNLGKTFALRIDRRDLDYFGTIDLNKLAGRQVIARGWVKQKNKQLRMRIRHSAELQIQ